MSNPFIITEIKPKESPLAELSKSFDELPDRVLNKSLGSSNTLTNLLEGIIPNKEEGLRRESEVYDELVNKYPENNGYEIIPEAYLRDSDGRIVKDPVTGEARRIDYVVVKDGKVVDSIEVTSLTADKTSQIAKENRIRESGGNYVRTADGSLAEFPQNTETHVERRK